MPSICRVTVLHTPTMTGSYSRAVETIINNIDMLSLVAPVV